MSEVTENAKEWLRICRRFNQKDAVINVAIIRDLLIELGKAKQLTTLQAKCDDYEKALSAILSNYTMPHCIADIAENVLAKHKE